jgi:hypothetical protein
VTLQIIDQYRTEAEFAGALVAQEFTRARQLVALALYRGAREAARTGREYMPRNLVIARQCGVCIRTVQYTTAMMETLGWLIKVPRYVVRRIGGLPKAFRISNRLLIAWHASPLAVWQALTANHRRKIKDEVRGASGCRAEQRIKNIKERSNGDAYQRLMAGGLATKKPRLF